MYGPQVMETLKVAWEATDHLCGKRLKPFLTELVEVLERHGELTVPPGVARQLGEISAATIDRLLRSRGGEASLEHHQAGEPAESAVHHIRERLPFPLLVS